ncbi:unnamed protein product [Vitrella brassicaformis CCMP3155]|uniref:Uncharacterized protein n=3 Tax=Vitrella brassicaformis TaxID=1169539 RepID=A0A0G4EQN7_VITBC|nr:unnamed protein product [Vitrella brassicaformis CCMP3155]|eukprot:CEL99553.1 unnamed protein product [Vitrella brassicaformis CCMP3155]
MGKQRRPLSATTTKAKESLLTPSRKCIARQLDSLSRRLELYADHGADVVMPLLRELTTLLHFEGLGGGRCRRSYSPACREAAAVAIAKLVKLGLTFVIKPQTYYLGEHLLAALESIIPDAPHLTAADEAIYIILLEVIATTRGGIAPSCCYQVIGATAADGTEYRDVILTQHKALLRRAEILLQSCDDLRQHSVLFLLSFYKPLAPPSCSVGCWMRLMGVAIGVSLRQPAPHELDVADSMLRTADVNISGAIRAGREVEVFAAIEEYLAPCVGPLVMVLTWSGDVALKRRAMSLIGWIFYFTYKPCIEGCAPSSVQAEVDKVLRQPVRVLSADPLALNTMAMLLGDTHAGGDDVISNMHVPLYIANHLSDPSLHEGAEGHLNALIEAGWVRAIVGLIRDDRLLSIEAFVKYTLPGCIYALHNMAQCDEQVLCETSGVSVVGAVCELLVKHARGDIDMIEESDMQNPESVINAILWLINEFVPYGERQIDQGKLSTNVPRVLVLQLPSIKELMTMPRGLQRLPREVFQQLDWLYAASREEQHMRCRAEEIAQAFALWPAAGE